MANQANPLEKYSYGTLEAVRFAQAEARALNHGFIDTEHLLLGIMRLNLGVSGRVLTNLGVDLERARLSVVFAIGRRDRAFMGDTGLTLRARQVIGLAAKEALRLKQPLIEPEHILLGLVEEGDGIAIRVLEAMGISLCDLHSEIMKALNESEEAPIDQKTTLAFFHGLWKLANSDDARQVINQTWAVSGTYVTPTQVFHGREEVLRAVSEWEVLNIMSPVELSSNFAIYRWWKMTKSGQVQRGWHFIEFDSNGLISQLVEFIDPEVIGS